MRGTGQDPFGAPTMVREWAQPTDEMEAAEWTMVATFQICKRLGLDYCFHDEDIAPRGASLTEYRSNLDHMAEFAYGLQQHTGVGLRWNTSNMFSDPRFAHGAATNPDATVLAHAGAQVKKMIEVGKYLGAKNYVFWGGREGYETLLNTDMGREQAHLARFLHMAVDYAKEIGFDAQFLIEPKAKEPTKHQYDFDAATVIGFLTQHGLRDHFKLNVEANHATLATHTFEHDLTVSSMNGMLGSIDANRGDTLLGWDTDQFPLDVYSNVMAMMVVLGQGGLENGGFHFDAKLRRGSTDLEDIFIAHTGAMDALARGARVAAKMSRDGALSDFVAERYASFDDGIGKAFENGEVSLRELEAFALAHEPEPISGKQELLENVVNQYIQMGTHELAQ
jgi:xylose isomerase